MFDSRGYWDDERHIVNPKPEIAFMSPEWQELVVFAIREAARLGLEFTMNMSSSGGKLDGPWEVGEDAPKRLVYAYCASPEAAKAPVADLPYYHDIDVQDGFPKAPCPRHSAGPAPHRLCPRRASAQSHALPSCPLSKAVFAPSFWSHHCILQTLLHGGSRAGSTLVSLFL